MDELLRWAAGHGADTSKVAVEGRSLFAKHDIQSGGSFLNIPQQLLLEASLATSPDYNLQPAFAALLLLDGAEEIDERTLLVLTLLLERAKGAASKWAPYIAILPRTYSDPCWWSPEELSLVETTRLGHTARFYKAGLEKLEVWRDKLVSICRQQPGLTKELDLEWAGFEYAIRWARSAVWSRAFNVRLSGSTNKPGICMVPVADMCDHSPQQHVAWHTGELARDDFQFISFTPLTKGERIFSNYGNKSNEELIRNYGFSLERNSADFFHISFGSQSQAPGDQEAEAQAVQRAAVLQSIRLPGHHYLRRGQPLPAGLVAAASVCAMPDSLAYRLLTNGAHARSSNSESVLDGEQAAMVGGAEGVTGKRKRDETTQEAAGIGAEPPEESAVNEFSMFEQGGPARNAVEVESQPVDDQATPGATFMPRLPLPFASQLRALGSLLTQLELKKRRIPGEAAKEDRRLAGLHASTSAPRMALSYRAGQKEIAAMGLQALEKEMSKLLDMASTTAVQAGLLSALPEPTAKATTAVTGCKVSLVLPGSNVSPADLTAKLESWEAGYCSQGWQLGIGVHEEVAPGETLAKVPAAAMLVAADELALKLRLLQQALLPKASLPSEDALHLCLRGVAPLPAVNLQLLSGLKGFEELEYLQSCRREAGLFLRAQASCRHLHGLDKLSQKRQLMLCCWADQAVERCALHCPHGVAILPLASAVPKELMGSVVDVRWEEGGNAAELVAKVPLEAGTQLSEGLLLLGQSGASVLTSHGFAGLYCLQTGQAGAVSLLAELGSKYLRNSHEMSVLPTQDDPDFLLKQELLVCSSLGFTHHVSQSVRLDYLVAGVAVTLATATELQTAGCQDLQEAYLKVQEAGPPVETAAGLKGVPPEDTLQDRLATCQQNFISKLLAEGRAAKAARKQVKAILSAAREEVGQGKHGKSLCEEHKTALKLYKADIKAVLKAAIMETSRSGKPLVVPSAGKAQGL